MSRAVISDFGGVLTTPLAGSFHRFHEQSGVTVQEIGAAMAALGAARGENPLYELETGRLSETDFLDALGAELSDAAGHSIAMERFGEAFFAGLSPNDEFLAYLRQLHGRGVRLAICTNNVREWSARWRAMIPDLELFQVVVDSSEVGMRKPDPRIYEIVLEQLGVAAGDAVFIDDLELNCEAARELGMHAVWFENTEQAIADTEAALGASA